MGKQLILTLRILENRFSSKKTAQHALFGSSIPKTVPCVCAFGCGLAFTMPPPNSGIVYEMERTELPMITGLLIPKAAGLRTRVVSFDKAVANLYKRRVRNRRIKNSDGARAWRATRFQDYQDLCFIDRIL